MEGHDGIIILQTPTETKNFFMNVTGKLKGRAFALVQADAEKRYKNAFVIKSVYPAVPISLHQANMKVDPVLTKAPKSSDSAPFRSFFIEVNS